jgi:hypothetical protein
MKKIVLKLLFVCFILSSIFSYAHAPNQSYLFLRIYESNGIEGRFDINVKELNKIFGFNLPKDANSESIKPFSKQIQDYLLTHASITSDSKKYDIIFSEIGEIKQSDGNYILFYFTLKDSNTLPENLDIFYNVGFSEDFEHKGFLVMEYNWKAGVINEETNIVMDFGPNDTTGTLSLNETSKLPGFIAMIKQGIWHIWIGFDHILFLLALILPAVVRRKNNSIYGWEPVMTFKVAFIYIIKVITFFTIAHTITLTLASLELVSLPSRLVESIIAFSIGLAAFHNIKPIFRLKDWVIAFIFGLFHGFGFASVLSDLGLTKEFLTLSLLGFNVGVEIGQLVIIAIIFPMLYLIRKRKYYPKFLVFMSAILIFMSVYWLIERVFDIDIPYDDWIKRQIYLLGKSLGIA